MRKMLNEWRKFLDEGSGGRWAFDPKGLADDPHTTAPEEEEVYTQDDEAKNALHQIRIELGGAPGRGTKDFLDRVSTAEANLLSIKARSTPGFWGELVMNLQDADRLEIDRVFSSVIAKLEGEQLSV